MHNQIEIIKKNEYSKVLKNIFTKQEIDKFLKLYNTLQLQFIIKNKMQLKKRWLIDYGKELENYFMIGLNEIGDFKYNLKTEDGKDILGLFQESYNPIDYI